MYPVNLNIRNRPVLVVGGGGVALRKVEGLLAEGAKVTVIAPAPLEPLQALATRDEIELEQRDYRTDEVKGFTLAFAATDDRDVNRRVFEDGEKHSVWVNVADDPELCAFHLPARVIRGALSLAVASAGEAPFVVRRLRRFLERRFGPEWAEWIDAAARFREAVRKSDLDQAGRELRYDMFFRSTVDPDRFLARVPTAQEQADWLDAGSVPKPEAKPTAARPEPKPPGAAAGLVSLTGAGPGDPGLLTIKGYRRLMSAGAVVYDRLAETALPCDLPSRVELHPVGKRAGHHPVPQEEINALLVRLALQGKRVVRLKGGDPFVFGRGGEEAEALRDAGIPFEVIPAPSAGVAVPAYAGIPVTHRKETVRVTMVTAHESVKADGPQVRWDLIGADPRATLLGYMGVTSLPNVVERLLDAGMDPSTPAAMVEHGTTSRHRVVRATVSELPEAVERASIAPPALFVIGPTVAHGKELEWFVQRPLFGHRIVVPAPAGEIGDALELAGAEVLEIPLPITAAARVVMAALPLTGCVFRSEAEVDAFEDERDGPAFTGEETVFCVGSDVAARARKLRWTTVLELKGAIPAAELVEAARADPRPPG